MMRSKVSWILTVNIGLFPFFLLLFLFTNCLQIHFSFQNHYFARVGSQNKLRENTCQLTSPGIGSFPDISGLIKMSESLNYSTK